MITVQSDTTLQTTASKMQELNPNLSEKMSEMIKNYTHQKIRVSFLTVMKFEAVLMSLALIWSEITL